MSSTSQKFKSLQHRCLEISAKHGLAHIPSALSMLKYVWQVSKHINLAEWDIVLGKPFGSGAYYAAWEDVFGWVPKEYHEGLNARNCPLVAFGEQTIGNALGVALGMALTGSKKVWCNLSDASLQMGQTLEAIVFMLHHANELGNLFVTVDCNDFQVLGRVSDILSIDPVVEMLKQSKLNVLDIKNPKFEDFKDFDSKNAVPTVVIVRTVKGEGVKEFEQDPVKFHYKTILKPF